MRVLEVVESLNVYSISKAFVAKCEDGSHWVVKGARNNETRLHMVREFVGGNLACWLGLPWPSQPEWLGFSAELVPFLKNPIEPGFCVATKYLPDLREPAYALEDPVLDTSNDRFMLIPDEQRLEIVKAALTPYLHLPGNKEALYGRVVFDNWLSEIDPMVDTLQLRKSGSFVCLDASTTLNSRNDTRLVHRQIGEHCVHKAYAGWTIHARAVLRERSGFQPWLKKLSEFHPTIWDSIVGRIPAQLKSQMAEVISLKDEICNVSSFIDDFLAKEPWQTLPEEA